jgi:hypothetical protein
MTAKTGRHIARRSMLKFASVRVAPRAPIVLVRALKQVDRTLVKANRRKMEMRMVDSERGG